MLLSTFFGLKRRRRRLAISWCSTILLLGLVMSVQPVWGQKSDKLNVLFIISDDLTATALSSYENPACNTPNIDELASEGTRFTRAYCQYPVCGPSRASLMFGYYPSATQTYGYVSGRENVGPNRPSWAELFKNNGYFTARVGKIFHMGSVDVMKGLDGKDDAASWTERYNSAAPEVNTKGESELVQKNPYGNRSILKGENLNGGNLMNIVKTDEGEIHTDVVTAEKVVELLQSHKNEPFFIAAGMFRPHVPFVAPKTSFEPYPYEAMVMPPQVENDWDDIPAQGINYVNSVNGQMTEEQEKKAIAAYYASTAFMDEQVGKILTALKREGLEDNTIVVMTSDHGYHLGEHRFWMKVSLMEESVRVPLIVKVPGKKAAVCHSFAELIDLYPTIATMAGLTLPDGLQGDNLSPLFDNPNAEVKDMAFSVSQRNGRMGYLVRTDKWAFIQYGENASGGMELYDMEYDVKQFNNLASNPQYAKVVAEMKERLVQKLKSVRDNDLEKEYTILD